LFFSTQFHNQTFYTFRFLFPSLLFNVQLTTVDLISFPYAKLHTISVLYNSSLMLQSMW
jgi:hypothetical protein